MSSAPLRRVAYLSGTRADFGLMRGTLERIASTPGVDLQLLVTGMHLSPEHGHTVDEIRAAGFRICADVPLDMRTRSGASMSLGIAECLRGVTEALERERPDLLLLLGDRGEMLAGAIAALHLGIPAVHLHGGERSGTVDEPVRHAISKLATHHLVATPGSRQRLIAMGEPPERIQVTGAPGLDGLSELGDRPRAEVLADLGLAPDARFVLVAFHPVVQQADDAERQAMGLAEALVDTGLSVVWLEPNADAGALGVLKALDQARLPDGSRRFTHLSRDRFAAAMRHAEALVGNSSAGIIEAASLGTSVLNIGDRQHLRERGANVVDVPAEHQAIAQGLARVLGMGRGPWDNPYGDGRAGERIAAFVAGVSLAPSLLQKTNSF